MPPFWLCIVSNVALCALASAGQYRQASRCRLAAYLDGEIAEIQMSREDYREAASNFKSQCDVYLAEAWPRLLADKLPSLMRCQVRDTSLYTDIHLHGDVRLEHLRGWL